MSLAFSNPRSICHRLYRSVYHSRQALQRQQRPCPARSATAPGASATNAMAAGAPATTSPTRCSPKANDRCLIGFWPLFCCTCPVHPGASRENWVSISALTAILRSLDNTFMTTVMVPVILQQRIVFNVRLTRKGGRQNSRYTPSRRAVSPRPGPRAARQRWLS